MRKFKIFMTILEIFFILALVFSSGYFYLRSDDVEHEIDKYQALQGLATETNKCLSQRLDLAIEDERYLNKSDACACLESQENYIKEHDILSEYRSELNSTVCNES